MQSIRVRFKTFSSEFIKNISVINILFVYRFCSLPIISIFFYLTATNRQLINKLIIIIGLIITYTTFTLLQYYNRNDKRHILILNVVETVGNSIFIIISGGFSSPFIWFFINTIFIAAVNSSYAMAIISAVSYFLTAAVTTLVIINPIYNKDIIRLYLNIAFSYIVVVWAIFLLIRYTIKVKEKSDSLIIMNNELNHARLRVEKALKLSMDLYETVNLFTLNNREDIHQLLVDHMKSLTGFQKLMFIQMIPSDKKGNYISTGLMREEEEEIFHRAIKIIENKKANIRNGLCYQDNELMIYIVVYEGDLCGAFVNKLDEVLPNKDENTVFSGYIGDEMVLAQTDVIATYMQITGMLLKKLEFDELEEQLVISEEQNRIANEIHDLVLQKLFALSCKLYIMSNGNEEENVKMKDELLGIRHSVDIIMKELRDAVYGMSWSKNGQDTFLSKLYDYVEELKYLHDVEINLSIEGDTQKINAYHKHNLYRVICEAINNSIRHGKANLIEIMIQVDSSFTNLIISDNGKGFNLVEYENKDDKGIGLSNIFRIIENNQGHIDFEANVPKGTKIFIKVPHNLAVLMV